MRLLHWFLPFEYSEFVDFEIAIHLGKTDHTQSAALVLDRHEDGGRSVSAVDEPPAHHNATELRLLPVNGLDHRFFYSSGGLRADWTWSTKSTASST
jgi:hypothetical protein